MKKLVTVIIAVLLVACQTPPTSTVSQTERPRAGAGSTAVRFVLAPSAARTAAFTGTPVEIGGVKTVMLQLDVTAASGTTPTLDVKVQTTVDGTNWCDVGAFAQATAVSRKVMRISTAVFPLAAEDEEPCTDGTLAASLVRQGPLGQSLRVKHALPGGTTPSFTYTVTAWAAD